MGFTSMVTLEDVYAMVRVWKNMCEFNMPTHAHVRSHEECHDLRLELGLAGVRGRAPSPAVRVDKVV